MKEIGFMMGGRVFVLLLVFILVSAVLVSAVDTSLLEKNVNDVKQQGEQIKQFTEGDRWVYLGQQWKEILLKSKVISAIDGFFRSVDSYGVFLFLFAEKYDLSFTFFFALIYWIFFFFILNGIFKDFLPIRSGISSLIAFASVILLGHIGPALGYNGLYTWLSLQTFKVIFYKTGAWSWVWTIIFFIIYFFVLVFIGKIIGIFKTILKKIRERREKNKLEVRVKKNEKFIEGVEEGNK